jgi:hypothetical protein
MSYKPSLSFVLVAVAAQALAVNFANAADRCHRVRAAFDVGSSGTKMKVFKVNICTSRIEEQVFPKTKEEKDSSKVDIPFKRDLIDNEKAQRESYRNDGEKFPEDSYPRFSERILLKAPTEFKRLKDLAAKFNPDDYVAVATEAFRQSQNADDLIKKLEALDIRVVVPAQSQEAMIEWMGVVADLRESTERKPDQIVSWGIGAGSMQMGARKHDGKFVTMTSKLASDNMLYKSREKTKGDGDLLPVSRDDIDQMVGMAVQEARAKSEEISDKLADQPLIVAVGGTINTSVKGMLVKAGLISKNDKTFTMDDVKQLLYGKEVRDEIPWTGLVNKTKTDPAFSDIPPKFVDSTVSNAALVYGVMKGLKIMQARFSDVDNTYGAPFTKEFGIHPKARAKKRSEIARAAAERGLTNSKRDLNGKELAEVGETLASESTSVGDPNENLAICNATPGHKREGNKCIITEPCMSLVDQSFCDGGLSKTKCIHKGNVSLVYNVCDYSK